jgi:hypothetical protein
MLFQKVSLGKQNSVVHHKPSTLECWGALEVASEGTVPFPYLAVDL